MHKYDKYRYWVMLSDYDIDTIDVLVEGKRWVYVTYLCQQAVERQLKGMYVYYTGKEAPKTHNISFLFKKITLCPDFIAEGDQEHLAAGQDNCEDFLIDAMFYYMSDYPFSYKNIMSRFVEKDVALELFQRTKDTIAWLRSFQPAKKDNSGNQDQEPEE